MTTCAARLVFTTDGTGVTKAALRFFGSAEVIEEQRAGHRRAFLSMVPNSKALAKAVPVCGLGKRGFGVTPLVTIFTRHAKHIVQEAAAALEHWYDRDVIFITATLPGSTPAALQAVADWSGYIVERFKQWLNDNCPGWEGVGVWERQKRGALHLHWAVGGLAPERRQWLQGEFHQFWVNLLKTVSSKAGCDMFERAGGGTWQLDPSKVRAEAVPVQKSVKRYLSKYLSKNKIERNNWSATADGTKCYFPSRWWGVSNSLRDKVLAARKRIETELLPVPEARALLVEAERALESKVSAVFTWLNPYRPGDITKCFCPAGDDEWVLWESLAAVFAACRVSALRSPLPRENLWAA